MSESHEIERRRRRAEEMNGARERRQYPGNFEFRDDAGDGILRLRGHAALFDVRYTVGSSEEVVARSAFDRTLREDPDVVLLLDHGMSGSGLPLARTKAGTMRISTDQRGLLVEADLDPGDADVDAVARRMRRGDLDGQMSMAFIDLTPPEARYSSDGKLRTLKAVSLHRGDLSLVTHAASPTTSASLRSATATAPVPIPDYTTRARQQLALMRKRDAGSPARHHVSRAAVGRVQRSAQPDRPDIKSVDDLDRAIRWVPDDRRSPEAIEQMRGIIAAAERLGVRDEHPIVRRWDDDGRLKPHFPAFPWH